MELRPIPSTRASNSLTSAVNNGVGIARPIFECSASSAGFARATDSWGRFRRGPPRPPPMKRRRWALLIALAQVGLAHLEGGEHFTGARQLPGGVDVHEDDPRVAEAG